MEVSSRESPSHPPGERQRHDRPAHPPPDHLQQHRQRPDDAHRSYLEPFYNGQALARNGNGELLIIEEEGPATLHIPISSNEIQSIIHNVAISYWKPFAMVYGIEAGLAGGKLSDNFSSTAIKRLKEAWIELGLLTDDGATLSKLGRSLGPGSIGETLIQYWLGPQLHPWLDARQRMSSGNIPDFFSDIASNSEIVELTQKMLQYYAECDWAGIANSLNIGGGSVVVDLAGGRGSLLREVLNNDPTLSGILFERPEVIQAIDGEITFQLIGGDIFNDEIPLADYYILSRVLHDWDNTKCIKLLGNISKSTHEHSTLIVIERVQVGGSLGLLSLNMYLTIGGMERTIDQWNELFTTGGWIMINRKKLNNHFIFILRKG